MKTEQSVVKVKNKDEIPANFTGIAVYPLGSKEWWLNGQLHRDGGPAFERYDGYSSWFKNGKVHREDGPARQWEDGSGQWWLDGKEYTKPDWELLVNKLKAKLTEEAKVVEKKTEEKILSLSNTNTIPLYYTGIVQRSNGTKSWFLNGRIHREDGPAIEYANGSKQWWLNGGPHRVDGPAIEYADGRKSWHLNGNLHREDGPAYEGANGYKKWYLNGTEHTEEEWKKEVAKLNAKLTEELAKTMETKQKPEPVILEVTKYSEIPKGFSGIVKYFDGNKEWYRNGKLHREDGPAHDGNNIKAWLVNGERHREDGPAYEGVDGHKEWFVNGKCHRVDGPAVEFRDGRNQWWLDGKNYTEENWKQEVAKLNVKPAEEAKHAVLTEPAVIQVVNIPKEFTGIVDYLNSRKEWIVNGKLHREDGPAKEWLDGTKEWWLNGQCHREDGPAVERANGDKAWYLNGELHRENGPSFEGANGYKEWRLNGILHSVDGPAREWSNGTKSWWLNGDPYTEENWKKEVAKLNVKPTEEAKPVTVNEIKVKKLGEIPKQYTGIVLFPNGSKQYRKDGMLHREDGPANEWLDGTKEWYLNGRIHRVDGPAADYADGTKQWWLNGQCHREDGPAVEYNNGCKEWFLNGKSYTEENWKKEVAKLNVKPVEEAKTMEKKTVEPVVINVKSWDEVPVGFTGILEWPDNTKIWMLNREHHRVDGPAIEWADGDKEWWLNGKRHCKDGPAIEYADGRNQWWLNGKNYTEENWKKELGKEHTKEIKPMEEIKTIKENEVTYSYSDAFKRGLKEGAKRAAVRKTRTIMLEAVCSILTSKAEKSKQGETARTVLKRFFESKQGEAMFSVAVGMLLPMIAPQIPQQYRKYVSEVAGELNAQGFDIGFTIIGDSIGPIIKNVTSQLTDTFKEVADTDEQETVEAPKTRVAPAIEKQKVSHEVEEMANKVLAAPQSVLSK
jgi:hypothetical protein